MILFNNINLLLGRSFHTSRPTFGLNNHKLYPKVDWEKVDAGNYAVVDPVLPGTILYLSEQDYIIMVRVAITSNKTLKVLAVPGDIPVTSNSSDQNNSQNSPHPSFKSQAGEVASWLRTYLFGTRTSTGRRGMKRTKYLFASKLLPFSVVVDGATSTFNLSEGILMVKLSLGNLRKWFRTWHDQLSWWSRGSPMSTVSGIEANSFALRLLRILKTRGINDLISRLKISLFVVTAFLGGRKLTSTSELGTRLRLRNGLPLFLPHYVRRGLRIGNRHYVRIWTSVLFSYKGLLGSWTEPYLADGSITQAHPQIEGTEAFKGFSSFLKDLAKYLMTQYGIKQPNLSVDTPFFSTKAGPNHPITLLGAGMDAYLWWAHDSLPGKANSAQPVVQDDVFLMEEVRRHTGVKRNLIRLWLEETGQLKLLKSIRLTAKMFALNHQIMTFIDKTMENARTLLIMGRSGQSKPIRDNIAPRWNWIRDLFFGQNTRDLRFLRPSLQRLHNLYEAAGKVRTIAIVDYWTNFVLKPLHDWMFAILRILPQDATFDQEGRVIEFAQRGYTTVYSYDLKSATDLIPIALYRAMFSHFLNPKLLDLWIDLLTDRDFLVPKSTFETFGNKHPARIRYGTGQPMGALTSWASMALVHHALVLYSAVLAGKASITSLLLFRDYMVLGDDIVIADAKVAEMYVWLMKELEIPIGLAKSHISNIGLFNFANQSFLGSINVSPASMREDVNANSLPGRAELALRLARRGWKDLTSRTWLIPLLKVFFDERMWRNAIEPLVRKRTSHPIIQWILAVLLTPGTTRFGFAGMSHVNLDVFLGAVLQRSRLWSTRVFDCYRLLDRRRSEALLISLLGKWIDKVYAQFLQNRKRFEEFDLWIRSTVSVELEWLFVDIFQRARKEAVDRWSTRHRLTLKERQIGSHMTGITSKHVFEIAAGETWNNIIIQTSKAEAELPLVPDFTTTNLNVLVPDGLGGGGAAAHLQRQLDSLTRVTSLLGMIDHLGATGTPGFVEPGNYSQSHEFINNLVVGLLHENKSP